MCAFERMQIGKCRGNYYWNLYLPLDTQRASFLLVLTEHCQAHLAFLPSASLLHTEARCQILSPLVFPHVALPGLACSLFLGTVRNKLSFQCQPLHLLASPYLNNEIYILKHRPASILETPPLRVWGTWRPERPALWEVITPREQATRVIMKQ